MRGIIGMRVNEIIDKLHEADFYIYEEEATSIKFNHNFLNGCNLAISLAGEIDLIDDSTYNMKLALYNSNWEGTNLVSGVARIDDNDLSMDNFLRFAERVDRHINGIFSKQYYRCREYPTTITKIEPKEWEKNDAGFLLSIYKKDMGVYRCSGKIHVKDYCKDEIVETTIWRVVDSEKEMIKTLEGLIDNLTTMKRYKIGKRVYGE